MFKKILFRIKYMKRYKNYSLTFRKEQHPSLKGVDYRPIADGVILKYIGQLCNKYEATLISCNLKDGYSRSSIIIKIDNALVNKFLNEFMELTNWFICETKFERKKW